MKDQQKTHSELQNGKVVYYGIAIPPSQWPIYYGPYTNRSTARRVSIRCQKAFDRK
jgi:hypothetical protein